MPEGLRLFLQQQVGGAGQHGGHLQRALAQPPVDAVAKGAVQIGAPLPDGFRSTVEPSLVQQVDQAARALVELAAPRFRYARTARQSQTKI